MSLNNTSSIHKYNLENNKRYFSPDSLKVLVLSAGGVWRFNSPPPGYDLLITCSHLSVAKNIMHCECCLSNRDTGACAVTGRALWPQVSKVVIIIFAVHIFPAPNCWGINNSLISIIILNGMLPVSKRLSTPLGETRGMYGTVLQNATAMRQGNKNVNWESAIL